MRDVRIVHSAIGMRLATDVRCRHYAPDVIAAVCQRTLLAVLDVAQESGLAGNPVIGEVDVDKIADRIAEDQILTALPPVVVAALVPVVLEIAAEEMSK